MYCVCKSGCCTYHGCVTISKYSGIKKKIYSYINNEDSLFLLGLEFHPEDWRPGGWNCLNAPLLTCQVVDVAIG